MAPYSCQLQDEMQAGYRVSHRKRLSKEQIERVLRSHPKMKVWLRSQALTLQQLTLLLINFAVINIIFFPEDNEPIPPLLPAILPRVQQ